MYVVMEFNPERPSSGQICFFITIIELLLFVLLLLSLLFLLLLFGLGFSL